MNCIGQGVTSLGLRQQVPKQEDSPARLLDSWKEIARYLGRDVRTVQRWEKSENLPVHRHIHKEKASVFAFSVEIERWRTARACSPVQTAVSESLIKPDSDGPKILFCPARSLAPRARSRQLITWRSAEDNGQTLLIYYVGARFGPGVLHFSGLAPSYSKEITNGMDHTEA
jgi:hypothetical protein